MVEAILITLAIVGAFPALFLVWVIFDTIVTYLYPHVHQTTPSSPKHEHIDYDFSDDGFETISLPIRK